MKKIVFTFVAISSILFMMAACEMDNPFGFGVRGNGVCAENNRNVTGFNAVDTRDAIDVIIVDIDNSTVKVSGDENLIDDIETSVRNGVLHIQFKHKHGYSSRLGLKVTIPNTGCIDKITVSGSSNVIVQGCLVSDRISISCKGSSNFKGSIKAESCNIHCMGSSDCVINGKADLCDLSLSGSSNFKGYDFIVNKLTCNASGSSDIKITCNEEISVRASGSSDVYYRGNAKVINKQLSGASSFIHK